MIIQNSLTQKQHREFCFSVLLVFVQQEQAPALRYDLLKGKLSVFVIHGTVFIELLLKNQLA